MDRYDILTLDNGKDYTISHSASIDGIDYLLLVEVDDDENILDDKMIVEKSKDGKTLTVVDDKKIYDRISYIFTKMISEDLNNS